MTISKKVAAAQAPEQEAPKRRTVASAKEEAAKGGKILVTTVHGYPLACVEQGVRITPGVGVEVENSGWIARQLKAGTIREM